MPGDHILLGLGWIVWCALHSLLISRTLLQRLCRFSPAACAWHRLMYNVFSTVTLLPLMLFTASVESPMLWMWPRALAPVAWAGVALGVLIALAAARQYDNRHFLGLRQIREHRRGIAPSTGPLVHDGILGLIRHPYYTAGILVMLCAGDVTAASAITRIIIIGYLIIGAIIEERKLAATHGDAWRRHVMEVSMFVPVKWIRRALRG